MKVAFIIGAAVLLALTACGGGGGGPNIGIDYEDARVRDAAVDTDAAILHTDGEPPTASRSEAKSEQLAILDRGNTSYMHIKALDEDGRIAAWVGYFNHCESGDPCDNATFRDYRASYFSPVMTKNGIQLAKSTFGRQRGDGGTSEEVGYGGWMEHSMFGVVLWSSTNYYQGETWFGGAGVNGGAFGDAPRTNPDTGPFEWTGVMVGRNSEIESSFLTNAVQGDALVEAELAGSGAMTVDVTFSDIKDLTNGNSLADMSWDDLPVVDGAFESSAFLGSFFGPQHEEVAGTFDRNNVIGAFGARR